MVMAVFELFNLINWAYSFTMPEYWNIYAICDLHCHFTGLNIKLCAPPAPAVEIFIITFHVRMRPAQPRLMTESQFNKIKTLSLP
jgi:hypothetical protein